MDHDCLHWNAQHWLSTNSLPPGLPGLPANRPLYQKLRGMWHPDRNRQPEAPEVFFHLTRLFQKPPASEELLSIDGRRYRLHVNEWEPTESGRVGWGRHHIVWRTTAIHSRHMIQGASHARGQFANDAMRQQFQSLLPAGQLVLTSQEALWVQPRQPDEESLQALRARSGPWPLAHAAWVVSSLLNLACYCEYRQLSHLGWTMQHLMVNTQRHQVRLAGGWWYATPWRQRAWAVPACVLAAQDGTWRSNPVAGPGLDVRAIQALARELMQSPLPAGFASQWLRHPWTGTAIDAYGSWRRAVERDLGPPRFTPFPTAGTFQENTHG